MNAKSPEQLPPGGSARRQLLGLGLVAVLSTSCGIPPSYPVTTDPSFPDYPTPSKPPEQVRESRRLEQQASNWMVWRDEIADASRQVARILGPHLLRRSSADPDTGLAVVHLDRRGQLDDGALGILDLRWLTTEKVQDMPVHKADWLEGSLAPTLVQWSAYQAEGGASIFYEDNDPRAPISDLRPLASADEPDTHKAIQRGLDTAISYAHQLA
jgi:hypothetical protein